MKKKYLGLILALSLLGSVAMAQQKLSDGTNTEGIAVHADAILELSSRNKGLLHTRIPLERTTSASPLAEHVAGMMVYNTARANDVVPGIYYNDGTKWVLASAGSATHIHYNPTDYIITYVDAEGNEVNIDFKKVVKDNETVTTLVKNAKGTYTYTSEDGTVTEIDIPVAVVENFETIVNKGPVTVNGDTFTTIEEYIEHIAKASVTLGGSDFVTVSGVGTADDPYVVSIREGAANTMLVTNVAGELEWATIESIVKANETVTTLIKGADGKYTYTSEDGTVTEIDIPADIVENFETIVNKGPVTVNGNTFNTVEEYIEHIANTSVTLGGSDFVTVSGAGTETDPYVVSIKEGAANSMLITDAEGNLAWATIGDIVKANETVTKITANPDGTYTYTNEEADTFIIDVPASVVNQFEEIYNDIVNNEIIVEGETYNTFEEYLTHLASESVNIGGGDMVTVSGTGTADDPYLVSIQEGAANSMLITDAEGNLAWATIGDIVKANETVTKIVANDNGTYTYTNEESEEFIIDVPASVVNRFEEIYNDIVNNEITVEGDTYNTFEEYLTHLANESVNIGGSDFVEVSGAGTADDPYVVSVAEGLENTMLITNAEGNLAWATIKDIVSANETVTKIIANDNGTYTYTNEENDTFIIDVPASVVNQFEEIYNDIVNNEITVEGETYNTFEEYLTHIANESVNIGGSDFVEVSGTGTETDPYVVSIKEGAANSMLITNAEGNLQWATIKDIVSANETITKIVANDNGTYTYTNEESEEFIIDVPASVVSQFEEIYNQIVNEEITVEGDTYSTFEEYLTQIASESVNIGGGDMVTVSGTGTADDPYVVSIKEGAANSMLITDAGGNLAWATIKDIVSANETVTKIVANDNGTYTYTNEESDEFIIDVPASVVNQFEEIYNDIVNEAITVEGETYNTFEEYLTHIANESVNIGGSDFVEVSGTGTETDPYVVSIKEGAANSMLITNAEGNLQWATIKDIVSANETITKIVANDNGTYTYTNEEDDTFIIDVPASVVNQFEEIYNDIVNNEITVEGETYNTFEEYLTHLASESVNIGGSDFVEVSGTGTETDPYVVSIKEGAANSMLITNAEGNLQWATIGDIVKENTTNALTLNGNELTSTVNGVDAKVTLTDANISSDKAITSNTINVTGGTGATLTDVALEIAPGAADQILVTNAAGDGVEWVDNTTTNALTSSENTLTSTVNGIDDNTTIINSVANTVNAAGELVTTVNGVPSTAVDLTSAIQANQKTVTVVDGENTTVEFSVNDNNTEYKVNVSEEAIQGNQLITEVAAGTGVTVTPNTVDNTTTYTVAADPTNITLGGDLSGNAEDATVTGLQGTPVSNTAPSNGQTLVFDGTNWVPGKPKVDVGDITDGKNFTSTDLDITGGTGATLVDLTANIKTGAVTSEKILDGTVTGEDLNQNIAGNGLVINGEQIDVQAESGVEMHDDKVKLGGNLTRETTITNAGNALTIATGGTATKITDLPTVTQSPADKVMIVKADGTLQIANAVMPQFFYAPAVYLPTHDSNGNPLTGTQIINLHTDVYAPQFGGTSATSVSSSGAAPLPVIPADQLDYYVTYWDTAVFKNVSISTSGVLTYEVVDNPIISAKTFMNVVFRVK